MSGGPAGQAGQFACIRCGYDLERTLRAGVTTCPECGTDASHMVLIDSAGKRPPVLIPRVAPEPVGWAGYLLLTFLPGVSFLAAALLGHYAAHLLGVVVGIAALGVTLYCALAIAERTRPLQRRIGARRGVFLALLPGAFLVCIGALMWVAVLS